MNEMRLDKRWWLLVVLAGLLLGVLESVASGFLDPLLGGGSLEAVECTLT